MESNEKSNEKRSQNEESQNKLSSKSELKVIQKNKTRIRFQENKPDVPQKSSNTRDDDAKTKGHQKESPQTTGDKNDHLETQSQLQKASESTKIYDDDLTKDQQQETSQTTEEDVDQTEGQQQETSQNPGEDEDHLEDQDQQQETPPFSMIDEGGDSEDTDKQTTEDNENSAEYETSIEKKGDSAQDLTKSIEKLTPISKGSEAKEKDANQSSSEMGKSYKKMLPDIPSTDIIIDDATLSRRIESREQATQEPVDKSTSGSKKSQAEFKGRKAIIPDISSSGILVDQESGAESATIQPPADFASSLFSTVLLEHERRSTLTQFQQSETQDRGFIIEATEEDIKTHFSKKSIGLLRKSSLKAGKKPSIMLIDTKSTASKMDEKEMKLSSKAQTGGLSTAPGELCSEWEPMINEPKIGYHYRMQSWVGSYIIGYNYWAKKDDQLKEDKEVTYNIDEGNAWYDISLKEAKSAGVSIEKKREDAKKKIEAIMLKAPEEDQRPITGGRRLPVSCDPKDEVSEQMKRELRDMFAEFSKHDKKCDRNRMSLKCADNWLEKVGILDYRHLTLIHTGLCFKAAGGSRYRGLTFEDFFTFLSMVADTRNMPLQHVINRLKLAILEN